MDATTTNWRMRDARWQPRKADRTTEQAVYGVRKECLVEEKKRIILKFLAWFVKAKE